MTVQLWESTAAHPAEDGYTRRVSKPVTHRALTAAEKLYEAKVATAMRLLAEVRDGIEDPMLLKQAFAPTKAGLAALAENHRLLLSESMTTSDFPLLSGDVLNRMLLGEFLAYPQLWREICSVTTLSDFRQVRRIAADGLDVDWSVQAEKEELQYKAMSETGYTYTPKKYACGARVSWEQLLNDDLNAFSSIPARLARGGQETIAKFVATLFSLGTNATFFKKSTNDNIVDSNDPLSIASLGEAMTKLMTKTKDGVPIFVGGVKLVYGPQNHVTVQNILNQLTVDSSSEGGTSTRVVRVNNWMAAQITPVLLPWLPIVDTTQGDTAWYLFADPMVGRPALEVGFLRGFESPALYQKASNTVRIGGGVDQNAGDFLTMCLDFKGVLAFGGATLDPRSAVASRGTGVAEP